jgi:hypothetical protein
MCVCSCTLDAEREGEVAGSCRSSQRSGMYVRTYECVCLHVFTYVRGYVCTLVRPSDPYFTQSTWVSLNVHVCLHPRISVHRRLLSLMVIPKLERKQVEVLSACVDRRLLARRGPSRLLPTPSSVRVQALPASRAPQVHTKDSTWLLVTFSVCTQLSPALIPDSNTPSYLSRQSCLLITMFPGCFLFLGPTGVGKTETARALARYGYSS